MIEPQLSGLVQWGFAVTSIAIIKAKLGGLYLDKDSECSPRALVFKEKIPFFFYSTHSSYWDPVTAAFLSVLYFKKKTVAPMDEKEFLKHTNLKKTGIFGVREGEGGQIERVLKGLWHEMPELSVWITPQGRFVDNRERQPEFKEGLSRWSLSRTSLRVPIAVDYREDGPKKGVFFRIGAVSKVIGTKEELTPTQLREDSIKLRVELQTTVDRLVEQKDLKKFKRIF